MAAGDTTVAPPPLSAGQVVLTVGLAVLAQTVTVGGPDGPYTVPRGPLVACNEKARMRRASSEGMMGSHPSELLIHQPTATR